MTLCSSAFLDLFLSSEKEVLFLLGNSDHFVFSVFIDFPSNSGGDAPFQGNG